MSLVPENVNLVLEKKKSYQHRAAEAKSGSERARVDGEGWGQSSMTSLGALLRFWATF